jgi:hypothetical protein
MHRAKYSTQEMLDELWIQLLMHVGFGERSGERGVLVFNILKRLGETLRTNRSIHDNCCYRWRFLAIITLSKKIQ